MSASIVLSGITWSTPDGRPLLSDLDLSFDARRTGLVGRNGVGKSTLLRLISRELSPQAGSVAVTGTIGVLRQALRVEPEQTVADLFGIEKGLALLHRAERGDASAEELERADWTLESRMAAALARLGLHVAPETRLATLSGGQRTRVGLSALAFAEPDFILLDEPTNNLDKEGRAAVADLLAGWRSGAIIVSHDRALLEVMDMIVELTSLGATVYGGNWSHYRDRKSVELAAARHDLADAKRRVGELARRARDTAERQARRDGVGRNRRAKGDMPRIQMNTLRSSSENTSGEQARLAGRRRGQALEDAAEARRRIEVLQPFSILLPSTGLPAGKVVLRIDNVTAGHAPERPILRDISLTITGPERLAIRGPNGAGKTTLVALVTGALRPWKGRVRVETPFAVLDQQVSLLDPAASIRDNFLRLNPDCDENGCRAALARFMFRAEAALQIVSRLSGGQMLRAGLACVLGGTAPPPFLILDEPTNHLDLESIQVVEAGLRAYDGALMVVSHDSAFLDSVGVSRRVDLPGSRP